MPLKDIRRSTSEEIAESEDSLGKHKEDKSKPTGSNYRKAAKLLRSYGHVTFEYNGTREHPAWSQAISESSNIREALKRVGFGRLRIHTLRENNDQHARLTVRKRRTGE